MYALRAAGDPKYATRYDSMIPFEGSEVQTIGEDALNWQLCPDPNWYWNFDGDKVYLSVNATSPLFLAFMKVKR